MRHDLLADCFSIIKNAENLGKRECIVPASKLIKNVLKLIRDKGYISDFSYKEDGRGGKFIIKLFGEINNCNVIKPRFSVKIDEMEKWEERYLPAKGFGFLILSTSKGILTHEEAREKNAGGRLLGFIY